MDINKKTAEDTMSDSVKNDFIDNKIRMDLLPLNELREVAKVYTSGAVKYGSNRWQELADGYSRYKGAMLRHLTEHERGNLVDSETGCLHMAQVTWNSIAMLHFVLKDISKEEMEIFENMFVRAIESLKEKYNKTTPNK